MPRGRPSKSPKKSPKKAATKGKRAKKDPNAPKRGMSAYMLWLQDNRAALTKPGMSWGEVSKAAGAEWKKMEVKEKMKWMKSSAKDKERYEREMAAYLREGPP